MLDSGRFGDRSVIQTPTEAERSTTRSVLFDASKITLCPIWTVAGPVRTTTGGALTRGSAGRSVTLVTPASTYRPRTVLFSIVLPPRSIQSAYWA